LKIDIENKKLKFIKRNENSNYILYICVSNKRKRLYEVQFIYLILTNLLFQLFQL